MKPSFAKVVGLMFLSPGGAVQLSASSGPATAPAELHITMHDAKIENHFSGQTASLSSSTSFSHRRVKLVRAPRDKYTVMYNIDCDDLYGKMKYLATHSGEGLDYDNGASNKGPLFKKAGRTTLLRRRADGLVYGSKRPTRALHLDAFSRALVEDDFTWKGLSPNMQFDYANNWDRDFFKPFDKDGKTRRAYEKGHKIGQTYFQTMPRNDAFQDGSVNPAWKTAENDNEAKRLEFIFYLVQMKAAAVQHARDVLGHKPIEPRLSYFEGGRFYEGQYATKAGVTGGELFQNFHAFYNSVPQLHMHNYLVSDVTSSLFPTGYSGMGSEGDFTYQPSSGLHTKSASWQWFMRKMLGIDATANTNFFIGLGPTCTANPDFSKY